MGVQYLEKNTWKLFSIVSFDQMQKHQHQTQQLTWPRFNNNGVTAGESLDVLWYTTEMLRKTVSSEIENFQFEME